MRSLMCIPLVVTMGLIGVVCSKSPQATAAPATGIKVPEESTFSDTVRSLHEQSGRVILAEIPQANPTLPKEVSAPTIEEALPVLAETLHFHANIRPRCVVIARAYGDPREELDLEPELIVAITTDIYRLIHGFAPLEFDEQSIREKNSFAKSFSGEQLRKLRSDGLSFSELRPEQARQWDLINRTNGYSELNMSGRRAARMCATLSEGLLAYRKRLALLSGGETQEFTRLWYEYPDAHPENEGGIARIHLNANDTAGASGASRPLKKQTAFDVTYSDAPPPAVPGFFRKRISLKEGPTSLSTMIGAIQTATGAPLDIPTYARNRKLLVFANGKLASDVITALQDLYGWTLQPVKRPHYRLERPRLSPAINAIDLFSKMRRAIPPTVFLTWRDRRRTPRGVGTRQARALRAVLDAAQQVKGMKWTEVQASELPSRERRILANLLFEFVVYGFLADSVDRPLPKWWLVAPETGTFYLGPTSDEHPLLEFRVPRPDGLIDMWGWQVGTSSLQD